MPYGSVPQGKTIVCLICQARKLEGILDAFFLFHLPPTSHHVLWTLPPQCIPRIPSSWCPLSLPCSRHPRSSGTFSNLPALLPVSAVFPFSHLSMLSLEWSFPGGWLDYVIPCSPGAPLCLGGRLHWGAWLWGCFLPHASLPFWPYLSSPCCLSSPAIRTSFRIFI